MFSTYRSSDRDERRHVNNEYPVESAPIIFSSQYMESNNQNSSYNNINNRNSIFIQPEQLNSCTAGDSASQDHLMILAAAAVNSSPSNDSCKSGGNISETTVIGTSESPHFSIHDPPLIRLSPTSPNNIFRHNIFNDEFTGIANVGHNNTGYSSNNVDWLSQELYVKTENGTGELTRSGLKRQSFTNSLSDTEIPAGRIRGRTLTRQNDPRDRDLNSSHSSRRPRCDLKRRRLWRTDSEYLSMVGSPYQGTTNAEEFATNVNTMDCAASFINLTDSDGESHQDERSNINGRLTPELPRHHYRYWPYKKRWPNPDQEDRATRVPLPSNLPHPVITSSTVTTSPLHESNQVSPEFSPCSPPFYMLADNSPTFANYPQSPEHNISNYDAANNDAFNINQYPEPATNDPSLQSNPIDYHTDEHVAASSNVSSYLRHILVPQLYNRRRYAASNLPNPFRDFSRYCLPHSPTRPFSYRVTSQFSTADNVHNYPRRSSSGSFLHTHLYDRPDTHASPANQIPTSRSSRVSGPTNNPSDGPHLMNDPSYRHNSIDSTMDTFLRAYGLEEVQQRQTDEPYQQRVHGDSVRFHPLLRLSERAYLNPSSQFPRPFAMYDAQGSVESVIQLALHLETSWSGITPEELSRLPCHYYRHDGQQSMNQSEKQDKCMVCLDEFVDNEELRTLICGHQYHVPCVDKWLKMNRTCPMCRSDAVLGPSNYVFVK